MEKYEEKYNEIINISNNLSSIAFKEEQIKLLIKEAKANNYPIEFCEKLNNTKLELRYKKMKLFKTNSMCFKFPLDSKSMDKMLIKIYDDDTFAHLKRIFLNFKIFDFDELEKMAKEYIGYDSNAKFNITTWENCFSTQFIYPDGRIKLISPTGITKEDIDNKTENFIILEKFLIYKNIDFYAAILQIIINDWVNKHEDTIDIINNIVKNSKMIQDENKNSVVKMFKYVLIDNDLETAMQKLVPIVESTTKYICISNGIDPYRLKKKDSKSVKIDETNMFSFLWKNKIFKEKFSEDIVFNFKNLFDSADCLNIRTDIAHGQLTSNEYYKPSYLYFLFFFLYLIFLYQ